MVENGVKLLHETLQLQEPTEFVYLSHDEMTEFLRAQHEQYPDITRLYSVGNSIEGREMWVLEISDRPGEHETGKFRLRQI